MSQARKDKRKKQGQQATQQEVGSRTKEFNSVDEFARFQSDFNFSRRKLGDVYNKLYFNLEVILNASQQQRQNLFNRLDSLFIPSKMALQPELITRPDFSIEIVFPREIGILEATPQQWQAFRKEIHELLVNKPMPGSRPLSTSAQALNEPHSPASTPPSQTQIPGERVVRTSNDRSVKYKEAWRQKRAQMTPEEKEQERKDQEERIYRHELEAWAWATGSLDKAVEIMKRKQAQRQAEKQAEKPLIANPGRQVDEKQSAVQPTLFTPQKKLKASARQKEMEDGQERARQEQAERIKAEREQAEKERMAQAEKENIQREKEQVKAREQAMQQAFIALQTRFMQEVAAKKLTPDEKKKQRELEQKKQQDIQKARAREPEKEKRPPFAEFQRQQQLAKQQFFLKNAPAEPKQKPSDLESLRQKTLDRQKTARQEVLASKRKR